MFENISKGEFSARKDGVFRSGKLINTSWIPFIVDETRFDNESWLSMRERVRPMLDLQTKEKEENAQFVSYCFNLQQRFDIGCYEEVIKGLELALNAFIEIGCTDESEIIQELSQILNKAKK